jgi:hypothetical protein
MNRAFRLRLLFILAFFAAIHRLPAPIQEIQETPTPARAEPTKKSRPKPTESETKSIAKPSPTTAGKKFAGTWSGIMPEIPWGNVQTELIVDQNETTMEWRDKIGSDSKALTAKTTLNGNTLSARFPVGFTTAVWFITPHADGVTADIRMTAFMNDDHAVFRRISR